MVCSFRGLAVCAYCSGPARGFCCRTQRIKTLDTWRGPATGNKGRERIEDGTPRYETQHAAGQTDRRARFGGTPCSTELEF